MTGILTGFVGATYSSVPGAPTGVSASATSSSAISVSFSAPAFNGGLSIDSYQVVCTGSGTNTATGSSSPISVIGLSAATSYTFKVRAHNSIGYGDYSSSTGTASTQAAPGSQSYITPGNYTWVAPTGVTSVSVVAVGGGGGAAQAYSSFRPGGGGGLGWKNNISVTPGCSYTVVVGAGGIGGGAYKPAATAGGMSYFINCSTVQGGHGFAGGYGGGGCAGIYVGDGGTSGGRGVGGYSGGGGAGGYTGTAGYTQTIRGVCYFRGGGYGYNCGSSASFSRPIACSGGASGGVMASAGNYSAYGSPGGGGVGIFGKGCDGGTPVGSNYNGRGGSGGCNANFSYVYRCNAHTIHDGAAYGGGAGLTYYNYCCGASGYGGNGGSGAVRIVWPGNTRQFPSSSVGSP
jgi:hypothetical protein